MTSPFTRNDWIKKIEIVLGTKELPSKERSFLTATLLYIYDAYRPTSFCNLSKEEYCQMYLGAVQKMESFRLFPLSSINEDSFEAEIFRKSMYEVKNGDFQKNNSGLFEVSKEGDYDCATQGVTISGKKVVCLDHDFANEEDKYRNCHHELTHLLEGKYSYNVPAKYPFSFEFMQMCQEGGTVSYEETLGFRKETQSDYLFTKEGSYRFIAHVPYPLYYKLYGMLEKWIGKDTIDSLRKNQDSQVNFFETVYFSVPNCPIEEVYANMVNILQYYNLSGSSYSQAKVDALKKSISRYRRHIDFEYTSLSFDSQSLENNKNYFKQCREEQMSINRTLNDPQLLEGQFLKEKQKLLTEIEEAYQQQRIPPEEYFEEKEEIEAQATLSLYRTTLCERSHSLQTEMENTERRILEDFQQVKIKIFQKLIDHRVLAAFERIFDEHLTLEDSFIYLKTGKYPKKKEDSSSVIEQMVQSALTSNQGTQESSVEDKRTDNLQF